MNDALQDPLAGHRRFLWGLCFRMTGVAADADDLVQETFARALEHPPRDGALPLRPWLTRIAVNAARDLLRRRKRAPYAGPWLPSPVEADALETEPPSHEPPQPSPEHRYELLESVSFAFLLALETLTPKARAVLLLRDVFDYPVAEVAEALEMSEANVKVVHHRARQRLAGYDARRELSPGAARSRDRKVLEAFMGAMLTGDVAEVERLLADEVVLLNDGAGEFHAARLPVTGAHRVARFLLGVSAHRPPPSRLELRWMNGGPAVLMDFDDPKPHEAPRAVLLLESDAQERVRAIHLVLASRKLTAVRR